MSTPWETLRAQMPVTQKWAYFDHAAVSPLPEPTRQVISDWGDHFAENGVVDWGDWKWDEIRDFFVRHPEDYQVDRYFTDFFGYNTTWNWNGFLRRMR